MFKNKLKKECFYSVNSCVQKIKLLFDIVKQFLFFSLFNECFSHFCVFRRPKRRLLYLLMKKCLKLDLKSKYFYYVYKVCLRSFRNPVIQRFIFKFWFTKFFYLTYLSDIYIIFSRYYCKIKLF